MYLEPLELLLLNRLCIFAFCTKIEQLSMSIKWLRYDAMALTQKLNPIPSDLTAPSTV